MLSQVKFDPKFFKMNMDSILPGKILLYANVILLRSIMPILLQIPTFQKSDSKIEP